MQPRLQILCDILFTNEAQINRDGNNNESDLHSSAEKSLYGVTQRQFQLRFSINVRCTALGYNLIGSHAVSHEHLATQELREFSEKMNYRCMRTYLL